MSRNFTLTPFLTLLLLALGPLIARGQPYKTEALAAYNHIVNRQKDFQRYEARLPANFPLGEGALVAFLEQGELRGVVVQYAGARSGDWQEFYYRGRGGSPFFVYSKYYNLESKLLYRNRFYLNDKRETLGWEINEVPQAVKGEAALLAVSRILEDSRQIYQLVTDGIQATAKAAQVTPPSIVDAMNDPANVPGGLVVYGPPLPDPSKPKAPAPPDKSKESQIPGPALGATLEKLSDESVDPELARWATWANATREHKETITPFPAELVLGKIDIPPMPESPAPTEAAQPVEEPPPPIASGPAPLPPPAIP